MQIQKTVIITGGNTGLGEQAALNLAREGWTIVIACRNVQSGEAAAGRIRAATPSANIQVLLLDLSDLESVERFAEGWTTARTNLPPLRAILANAGIQHSSAGVRTAQGVEATFGVNVLAHLLLIERLLPALAEPATVVVVGSGTHKGVGFPPPYDISVRALAYPGSYAQAPEAERRAGQRRYSSSKLAVNQLVFYWAQLLSAENRQITINVFDPGLMLDTQLSRSYPPLVQQLSKQLSGLIAGLLPNYASTPKQSGAQLAQLINDPAFAEQTGVYFEQGGRQVKPKIGEVSALSRDSAKQRALGESSQQLLRELT